MKLFTPQKWMEERQVKLALTELGLGHCAHALRAGESPDFTFPLDGRPIGIELVEFFYPTEQLGEPAANVSRGFQILRHIAVEKARQRFRDHGGPALYVNVMIFNDYPYPQGPNNRAGVEDFAERFEHVVMNNGWPDERFSHWPFYHHPDLPEVSLYVVSPSVDDKDELWVCSGRANGPFVLPEHVQDVLDKKAKKHESYAAKCDAVWLLIVNGGAIRTIPCELGDDAREWSYSFPFERAIWFDRFPPNAPITLKRCP